MALLDEKTRIEYLKELGYGSVKGFQAATMYPKWVDGIYGQQTDNALRTAINVKRFTHNFTTKEFMCECGGGYCGGYPDYMKPEVLKNIQAIRDHWGRPVTITCGLRDRTYNSKLGGSIQNSLHLCGQAVDFYQAGVTDTLAHRKSSIKWIKTLPNHHYTYGNGINSYGNGVSAPYMGNALHTDVTISVSPYDENGKLICDGIAGEATIKRAQQVFGTAQDGVVSGQTQALIKKYCPSLKAVAYNKVKSTLVKRIQKWAGTAQDGVWGKGTSIAVQNKLNSEGYNCGKADGIFGKGSMSAFQRWLNDHNAPTPDTPTPQPSPTPTPTPSKNIFDKGVDWLTKIANDNSWHYVKYNSKDAKTKECPICHNHGAGKYHGWNCIGESFAFWRHGCGIPCKCANNVINNAIADKLLKQSDKDALATLRKKIGLNDIQVIRNGGKTIPQSMLKKGDICLQYKGNTYAHTFPYIGNGYTIDCGNYSSTAKQIAKRKAPSCKVAIRYIGK